MIREVLNRHGSTVGPGSITLWMIMPIDKGKLHSQNQDKASSCILKVTGVLIEKTLMYIFSKAQLFEVSPRLSAKSTLPKPAGT